MNLLFDPQLASNYVNLSQKIRVMTESWVNDSIFCPNCGTSVSHYENNRPAADFYCSKCKEEFELKSKHSTFGSKIVDGAYSTMIERLHSDKNPNLFLLGYDPEKFEVQNFLVIPKYFFVPSIIEMRKPLSLTAIRAGWVGCNILLDFIPQTGKIYFIKNRQIESKNAVLTNWHKTLFLRDEKNIEAKGWLLDIMNCVGILGHKKFTLDEMYFFENLLGKKHPDNKHIKEKIRQQLQILRDKGYLDFLGSGSYKTT